MSKGPEPKIEVKGATKAEFDLKQLGVRAADIRPVGREVQTVFLHGEERRFGTRADGSWKPLQDSTLAKKSALGQSSAVLRATDRLYRSLTSHGGGDQIGDFDRGELRFGTKVEYAHFLLGTEAMPARPPIGIRPSDLHTITRILAKHINPDAR